MGTGEPGAGSDLPCLPIPHISTEAPSPASVSLPPSARRTAYALQCNTVELARRFGLDRLGFLTLTFRDHVTLPREAARRFNSLATHVLRPRYGAALRVLERCKSGRIHYHCLLVMSEDIRTGVDFAALERRDYRSAPRALRDEWAFWRQVAPVHGFGRTELLPVKSTAEAIGRYVGKYVSKHIEARHECDRNVRLVGFIGAARTATTRFAWASVRAANYRARIGAFIRMCHDAEVIDAPTFAAMKRTFGPQWCWQWRDCIATFPLTEEL